MSNLKIHFSYALFTVIGIIGLFFLFHGNTRFYSAKANDPATTVVNDPAKYGYKLTSQSGYNLIRPLLMANQSSEAPELATLKAKIMNEVEDDKRIGMLSSATVYLSSLSDGKWMYINPDEMYHPGSLIKMPMMITYLREAEADPSILDKKITFDKSMPVPSQTFNSNSVVPGNTYTVKELLHYMIAYSDNNATRLLNNNVVLSDFLKTFKDLNMPEPDVTNRNYAISAKNISDFLSVLYYATYLNRSSSESAMELLTECDFKDGMVKNLPSTVKVAHKFGEWGGNRINIHELHEAGIVFIDKKPYLLTVMTTGNNSRDMSAVISKISRMVYDDFSIAANPSM